MLYYPYMSNILLRSIRYEKEGMRYVFDFKYTYLTKREKPSAMLGEKIHTTALGWALTR